jgi:hypothetical protein
MLNISSCIPLPLLPSIDLKTILEGFCVFMDVVHCCTLEHTLLANTKYTPLTTVA